MATAAALAVFVLMTTAATFTFSVLVTSAAAFTFTVLVTATASVAAAAVSVAMTFARREEFSVKAFAQFLLSCIPDSDDFTLEVHTLACHRWVEVHSDLFLLNFYHHTPANLA